MLSWKIYTSFLLILLALCSSIAGVFYYHSKNSTYVNGAYTLQNLSESTMQQLDVIIREMDSTLVTIAASEDFAESMKAWSGESRPPETLYRLVNVSYNQNLAYKNNIRRIMLFTPAGKLISFGENQLSQAQIVNMLKEERWQSITKGKGQSRLVSSHFDPWVISQPERVVSLLRSFYSGDTLLGYLEVQISEREIVKVCNNKWNNKTIYYSITDDSGNVFAENFPAGKREEWIGLSVRSMSIYPTTAVETPEELLCSWNSSFLNWKTTLILTKEDLYVNLNSVRNFLAILTVTVMALAALAFLALIKRQTKPLYKLIGKIRKTDLDNLDVNFTGKSKSYEVRILENTFADMQTRLAASLANQKALEALQYKTVYDALQSRIDPHFLYNTLGSIANMCESGKNDAAADACYHLCDFLRYSTKYSDSDMRVQLLQELENAGYYLALMVSRYMHRLKYTINCDPELFTYEIPKLTLQPLIENAIKYSLTENETIVVDLSIYKTGSNIVISVEDNGVGFTGERLKYVKDKTTELLRDLSSFSFENELNFGGMGLIGTLLRLYLFFKGNFRYEISSAPSKFTKVLLYLPFEEDV